MLRFHRFFALMCAVGVFSLFGFPAEGKDPPKQVAGILIEKKDKDKTITVKIDGEDEPTKFTFNDSDKKLIESMKPIFGASRVQLTYKKNGDDKELATIKKQVLKATGTITGTVVKVYDNFWVEVKPKTGLNDAFAPGAKNYNDKEFMEKLKGLQKGDSVTITYTTDSERHRIETLKKN